MINSETQMTSFQSNKGTEQGASGRSLLGDPIIWRLSLFLLFVITVGSCPSAYHLRASSRLYAILFEKLLAEVI